MNKGTLFVVIQAGLFAAYILNIEFQGIIAYELVRQIGLLICVIGIGIILVAFLQLNKNISPFPAPKVNSVLITNGVYALVRHPIYSGIILSVFGYGFYEDSIWKLSISMMLLVLFHFKAEYE
jgi:protein-S-isoprenylcysteine O-methyltransferase Ste14